MTMRQGPLDLSVLDELREGVQVIDREWRYRYVNAAAARHGRQEREALVGRTMMEAYPGIDAAPFFEVLRRCMRDRVAESLLNRFEFPDGRAGWFELRVSPVPEGLCVLSVDVTERLQVEEQLRIAQRMESIGVLASGIAHDFNNLLSVVLTYAGFALEALPASAPVRDDVEEIRQAGLRAAALTQKLLAFGRKQVVKTELLDVNEVVTGLETMLRRLVGEGVSLRLLLSALPGLSRLDRGQVEQVLMNLVVNARDAMPAGGTLTLRTERLELDGPLPGLALPLAAGSYVLLEVTDTGTGMDAGTLGRIFEPFFTTKVMGKGTGLGLSTVFGIVKQSSGSIGVESAPGRGTTFRVYFPLLDLPRVVPEGPPSSRPEPGGRELVLVVEDDAAVGAAARRILSGLGYEVYVAGAPEEALALAGTLARPLDLLLTDVVLPGMNGPTLARRLSVRFPKMRVAYMSGYAHEAIARHGVLESSVHLVTKPFTAQELSRGVREAIRAPT